MKTNNLIIEFRDYLQIERRLSDNTVNSYIFDIGLFYDFIKKDLITIEKDDIKKYLSYLNSRGKAKSINRYLTSLKQFYKYLEFCKVIKENPLEGFKSLKTEKKLPNYLTVEEVNLLLDISLKTSLDYRNKAMLELLYATGMRISELVNLEINNIDFENAILKTITKGNKERILPIGTIALDILKLYINEHRPTLKSKKRAQSNKLFLNFRGEGITRNGFNLILKDLKTKTNINKVITPHVLRHSFATHLIEAGADIRVVQELMGHENIETTEIYTHLSNRYVKDSYSESHSRSHKEDKNV